MRIHPSCSSQDIRAAAARSRWTRSTSPAHVERTGDSRGQRRFHRAGGNALLMDPTTLKDVPDLPCRMPAPGVVSTAAPRAKSHRSTCGTGTCRPMPSIHRRHRARRRLVFNEPRGRDATSEWLTEDFVPDNFLQATARKRQFPDIHRGISGHSSAAANKNPVKSTILLMRRNTSFMKIFCNLLDNVVSTLPHSTSKGA